MAETKTTVAPTPTPPAPVAPVAAKAKMLEATIHLKTNKHTELVKTGVTPIEALIYTSMFHRQVGACPFTVIGTPVEVERSTNEEVARLRRKYRADVVKAVCNEVRDFPITFEQAEKIGLEMVNAGGGPAELGVTKLL